MNPLLLGAGLVVFVEILLNRTVHDVMDSFRAAVQARPESLECHLVAGGFDDLLKTRAADMAAYCQCIGSVIWALPGVRETRTCAAKRSGCMQKSPTSAMQASMPSGSPG